MRFFDVIKCVMTSTVPERKKWIPKLSEAHKAKVTVTLRSKTSRFWPINPAIPT